jgi:hypothetical protein
MLLLLLLLDTKTTHLNGVKRGTVISAKEHVYLPPSDTDLITPTPSTPDAGKNEALGHKNALTRCLRNDLNQTGVDLVMSTFVTNDRPRGNRYPRLAVFNATLRSYASLPIDRVYLFIEFDVEFKWFEPELASLAFDIWGDKLQHLSFTRKVCQQDLAPLLYSLCDNGDRLILFTSNDDHVFIDYDVSIFSDGLRLAREDRSIFKTIYYSHWPEAVGLSAKRPPGGELIESYVRSSQTLADSVQIFNAAYLNFMFVSETWPEESRCSNRIDSFFLWMGEIWTNPGIPDKDLQIMFVPLRELFRKFDGYGHVRSDMNIFFPPLELPLEHSKLLFGKDLKQRLGLELTHSVFGGLPVPMEWIKKAEELYADAPG